MEGEQSELFDVGGAIDSIAGEMGLEGEKKPTEGQTAGAGEQEGAGQETGGTPPTKEPAPAVAPGDPAAPGTQPPADPAAPVGIEGPPPDTWTAAGKAQWAALPPAVKAEVLKREADIERGITEYSCMAKVGQYFAQQVQPYADLYSRNGMQAEKLVQPLLNAYATITWGTPEQKVQMLTAIAAESGIDLSKVGAANPHDAVDPRLTRLQGEINSLRQGVQQSLGAIQQTRHAEVSKSVEAFAADAAKHPYFWDVIDDMKRLVDSGVFKGLDDAYDKAVMYNPLTRAKEIDRLAAEKAGQKAKETAEKAKQVKKVTAHNVRSSEQGGAAPGKLGSIDDTLNEALAKINARD